jgi:hypothetical protein
MLSDDAENINIHHYRRLVGDLMSAGDTVEGTNPDYYRLVIHDEESRNFSERQGFLILVDPVTTDVVNVYYLDRDIFRTGEVVARAEEIRERREELTFIGRWYFLDEYVGLIYPRTFEPDGTATHTVGRNIRQYRWWWSVDEGVFYWCVSREYCGGICTHPSWRVGYVIDENGQLILSDYDPGLRIISILNRR